MLEQGGGKGGQVRKEMRKPLTLMDVESFLVPGRIGSVAGMHKKGSGTNAPLQGQHFFEKRKLLSFMWGGKQRGDLFAKTSKIFLKKKAGCLSKGEKGGKNFKQLRCLCERELMGKNLKRKATELRREPEVAEKVNINGGKRKHKGGDGRQPCTKNISRRGIVFEKRVE